MVFCPKGEEILWNPPSPPPTTTKAKFPNCNSRKGWPEKKRACWGFFSKRNFMAKQGVCVCLSVGVFSPLSVAHKIEQSLICVNVRFSANFRGNKFFLFRFFPALPAQFTVFRLAFIPELVFWLWLWGRREFSGRITIIPHKKSKRIKKWGDPYLYPSSSFLKGGTAFIIAIYKLSSSDEP